MYGTVYLRLFLHSFVYSCYIPVRNNLVQETHKRKSKSFCDHYCFLLSKDNGKIIRQDSSKNCGIMCYFLERFLHDLLQDQKGSLEGMKQENRHYLHHIVEKDMY